MNSFGKVEFKMPIPIQIERSEMFGVDVCLRSIWKQTPADVVLAVKDENVKVSLVESLRHISHKSTSAGNRARSRLFQYAETAAVDL